MKINIEVVAAIIEKDGLYFCAQRADKGELAKKWEFPGGKIELGETHEEALIREIKEELSAEIIVEDFISTVEHEYNSFYLIMHCYNCRVVKGELIISEHLASKWASLDEMLKMDFAQADIPIITKLHSK